jgi:large subunit ribosomal protein L21
MNDFAIIKTGGKQYKVSVGDILKVEKLPDSDKADEKKLNFIDLLNQKKVTAEIIGDGLGKKVLVYKFHSKKRYERTRGHRQKYSEIKISSIS